jgi:hypothetical protein
VLLRVLLLVLHLHLRQWLLWHEWLVTTLAVHARN